LSQVSVTINNVFSSTTFLPAVGNRYSTTRRWSVQFGGYVAVTIVSGLPITSRPKMAASNGSENIWMKFSVF